jgi:hypothetical protein
VAGAKVDQGVIRDRVLVDDVFGGQHGSAPELMSGSAICKDVDGPDAGF